MSGTSTLTSAVSLVLVLALPGTALADKCAHAYKVTTPCEGLLLPEKEAGDGLKCLKTCGAECDAKLSLVRRDLQAEHATTAALLAAERDRSASLNKLLDKALQKAPPQEPALWERNGFWGGVGVVAGVLLTVAGSYVLGSR